MIKEKIIQIVQWLIIILLAIACFCLWRNSKNVNENLIEDASFQKNETQYVDISRDKTLNDLKKENRELYDSINKLSNVKEAIQIKYITKYSSNKVNMDSTNIGQDSIYHYSQSTDTISYDLDIKGKDVEWFKLNFSLRDSLMLVTRSLNGQNETTITHGMNTTITDVTTFVPKKTFSQKLKERTYFGVGIGVGYGLISKKPDIYIGINAGIKF